MVLSQCLRKREYIMLEQKVKVLVIDDSVLVRKYATEVLSRINGIEVVGSAPNGKIGLQKIYLYRPDVVLLDIEMPEMDGIELLKVIKKNRQKGSSPYVIIFSSLVEEGAEVTFEALAHGAVDFIKKPEGKIADNIDYLLREFEEKILGLYSSIREKWKKIVIPENRALEEREEPYRGIFQGIENLDKVLSEKPIIPEIVVIGASTGGPVALRRIFEDLEEIPVPMVIVQHMPAGFTLEFAKNLRNLYERRVEELCDGDVLENGTAYICPGGFHSRIERNEEKLVFRIDREIYEDIFFKPSVDIFLSSVYQTVGKNSLVVILSGMGRDGTSQCFELRKEGAIIIAQDMESSVVWGMPGSAVKRGGVDIIVNLEDIGRAINKIVKRV